jgi:ferric-dicitrate binding protein FerR (iron transport regulator)
LIVHDGAKPFVIHTRNLVVTVQGKGARNHVDAFASSPGEEVDLLEGKVKVIKSYHSTTDNSTEALQAGEMVMINRDIDLMEKETLKPEEQKALELKFPPAAGPGPRN